MVEERLSAIKNILDGMKLQTDEVRFYIPASKFTLRPEVNLPFCQTEITLLFFFFIFFYFWFLEGFSLKHQNALKQM
jgi:hypothetical protein